MNDLQKALLDIQQKLKAPKKQYNSFSKFYYRNAEDILEALKPLLKEHAILQTISDEVVEIGGKNYVKATVRLEFNDQYKEVTAYAREEDNLKGQIASQITGGTSSYARKYALNGLYNIDDTDDIDRQNNKTAPLPPKAQKDIDLATPKQKAQLNNMMTALNMDNDAKGLLVESVLNKPTVDTYKDFQDVVKALEEK